MRGPVLRLAVATLLASGTCAAQTDPAYSLPRRATAAEAAAPVFVRQIRFRGNTVLPTAALDRLALPYANRVLGEAERERLRLDVTEHYVAAGYINSGAVLGPQALEGDVLTLDIVEGRLSAIRIHGMARLRDAYLLERLGQGGTAPFNMEALRERFTLLLSDPLFERLNARLIPGAKPGEAILDVDVTRARPYRLSVFANNYRPPSIGANAAGLKGSIRNLTGWGDLLELNAQAATGKEHSPRTGLGWSAPLTPATSMTLQWEHGESSVIEEPLRLLDIKSILDSKELGLSHVLAETLAHKVALGLAAGERRNSTTLAGEPFSFTPGEPDGTTRVRAWRFWQEGVWRTTAHVLALRSTFTVTRNNTHAIAGLPDGGAQMPATRAWLWQGQGQYARQVMDNGAQLLVRTNLQWTNRTLVALDRMAAGGNATVRGFRENSLIRDRAAIVTVEFDYPLRSEGMQFALVPFLDAAWAGNRGEDGDAIASLGLATRLRWKGLGLDLAWARRLKQLDGATAATRTWQDRGVHAQLSYEFY
jgi:hemolysin activation/secretion protein